MNKKRLVVGNWKMNPSTLEEAKHIALKIRRMSPELRHTENVICPPHSFISSCVSRKSVRNHHIGAQSVSFESSGSPHTGEVGAVMLKDIGVEYVIVGHSEQRTNGDTDETVSKRLRAVLEAGLKPILCCGESVRDENGLYLEPLKMQIKGSLANIPKRYAKEIIMAYEPVWAIGAKEPMKPEQIHEMSLFVKKVFADVFGAEAGLKATVLYGGSVNFRNAGDIVSIGKVDGFLVGRESVNIVGFVELLKAVDGVN